MFKKLFEHIGVLVIYVLTYKIRVSWLLPLLEKSLLGWDDEKDDTGIHYQQLIIKE